MLHREGTAEGEGAFDGAQIVEYGWHDVDLPDGAEPLGYLVVTTAENDIAYLRFDVGAVFLGGDDGPQLKNSGVWKLVSGTGRFADMTGLGTVVITPGEQTKFSLEGEIAPSP